MKPLIWCDRLVRLDDGCLVLSRAGDHADFDFFPDKPDDDMAFAFNVNGRVYGAAAAADGSLAVDGVGGTYRLPHDRVWRDDFRIELAVAKINRTPVVWVPELLADVGVDWSKVEVGHPPTCGCEECRLKESVRVGSADNPVVTKPSQEPS